MVSFSRRGFTIGAASSVLLASLPLRTGFAQGNGKANIVCSFSILADIVANIAPAAVQVSPIVGPNSDAHVFNPKPSDLRQFGQADIVFFNGLGFEGWLTRMVQASAYKGQVVEVSKGIEVRRVQGRIDPHAWQNLQHGMHYAEVVRRNLSALWPAMQDEITARHASYSQQLMALDEELHTRFSRIPASQRKVITSHDAFGYFGQRYGVQFIAPQGWTSLGEPSAAAMARLIRLAKTQNAKGVFLENISDPRLMEQIAREAGARVGGTLYSDALSPAGGPASTYLDMFKHNSKALLDVLDT